MKEEKPYTLEEFVKQCNELLALEPGKKSCSVNIVVSEPGMPTTPSVGVVAIHAGFDWDNWQILLYPKEPLVRKIPKTKKKKKEL